MNKITIKDYIDYNEEEIIELYKSVGWSNYYNNPTMLYNAYKNSLSIMAAYDNEVLIGIIRVVGDGHSIIYIQDLLVLPKYQRHGTGSMLITKVLEKYDNVYQKILLTEKTDKTVNFYKKFGYRDVNDLSCVAFQHIK